MSAIYKRFPTRVGEAITGLQFGDQSLNETEYPWRTIAYECLNSSDRPDSFLHTADHHYFIDGEGDDIVGIVKENLFSGDHAHPEILIGTTPVLANLHSFIGGSLDPASIAITESGGTVSLELEQLGGGNLRYMFSDGTTEVVCAPATVALTAGTDTVPVLNYVYILGSTGLLTKSTTDWPATEYAPIATVLCQTAVSVAADEVYKLHAWFDHTHTPDGLGHIGEINRWIRSRPAGWVSGAALTPTGGASTYDIATTAGVVRQLHEHVFPAFDTSVADHAHVINDSVTPYLQVSDLFTITDDSLGVALKQFYSFVFWGSVNENGTGKLFLNLPAGSYNNDSGGRAVNDDDSYSNYTIPTDYVGTGFLIARITVSLSGGIITIEQNEDLRGSIPNVSAGSTGVIYEFPTNLFRVQDATDPTKELALDLSGITTGTTRTITVPDEDFALIDWTLATENFYTSGYVRSEWLYLWEQSSAPSTPAGNGSIWVKDDAPSSLYFTNDVGTDFKIGGHEIILTGLTTETNSINVGVGRSGDGISQINLVGDATYSTYGLQVLRPVGANAHSQINHRGTGALLFQVIDDGGWQMVINSNQIFDCWDTGIWMGQETEIDAGLLVGVDVTVDGGSVIMAEKGAPTASVAGYGQIFVWNDVPNTLWFTNDAGTSEKILTQIAYDTSPQLGADLDTNGFGFTGVTSFADVVDFNGAFITTDVLVESTFAVGVTVEGVLIKDSNMTPDTITIEEVAYILERAAALGDTAGYGQIWIKNTTPCELWYTDDAGTDFQLGAGGGGDVVDDLTPELGGNLDALTFHLLNVGKLEATTQAIGTETARIEQNTAGSGSWPALIVESKNAFGDQARINLQNNYKAGGAVAMYQDYLGDFYLSNVDTDQSMRFTQSGSVGTISFYPDSTQEVTIHGDGDVGIGIGATAPSGKLHADQPAASNVMMAEHSGSFWAWLHFRDSVTTGATYVGVGCVGDTLLLKGGATTNLQIDATSCLINVPTAIQGVIQMEEQAAADADDAGYGQIWVKNTTPCELWYTDDAGTDVQLGAGGSVSPLTADLDCANYNLDAVGSMYMNEKANANGDIAGDGQFWVKTATPNWPMFTDDGGTDHNLIGAEGTFTPTLQDSSHSDAESQTYTRQDGSYTLVGDMVFFTIDIIVNSIGSLSGSGQAFIAGLPFTSEATYDWAVHIGYAASLTISAETSISGWIGNSVDYISLRAWDSTIGQSDMSINEFSTGGQMKLSGCYRRA